MKLPQINYGGRVGVNQTIGPQAAVQDYRAKQGVLQEGFRVGEQIAEQKIENDAARANAAYRDQVFKTQEYLATKDVLSRDELIALGADETNQNIRWQDDDGNDIQSFKRYEVEAPLMAQAMETTLNESGANIASTRYRQAWQNSVRENNQEEVLRIAKRSAGEAKQFETKTAIADAEALNDDPVALMEYLDTSPVFKNNPDLKEKYLNKAQYSLAQTESNAVINNGTDEDVSAYLEKVNDPKWRESHGITEREAQSLRQRVKTEDRYRTREARILSSENDAERNKIGREALDGYVKAHKFGATIDEEYRAEVQSLTAGTDYADSVALIDKTQEFGMMDSQSQRDALADTDSPATIDEFGAYTMAYQAQQEAVREDGMQYAINQGFVEDKPINPTDPEAVAQRLRDAEKMSLHYGVRISPFTQQEVNSLTQNMSIMTSEEIATTAMAFGSESAVWSQFEKSGASVFAWSGSQGDYNLAETVARGQKEIDAGQADKPTPKDFSAITNDYLGNVYGPEDKTAAVETAMAWYVANGGGSGAEGFSDVLWEEALDASTGGVGDVNGNRIAVPRGTEVDTFQDYVSEFTADDLPMKISGLSDEEAAQAVREGQWVSVGVDQYQVWVNGRALGGGPPVPGIGIPPAIFTYGDLQARKTSAANQYGGGRYRDTDTRTAGRIPTGSRIN